MTRFLLAGALVALAACDDTVFTPCGELTPDWHGVQCTVNTHCVSCHGEQHVNPPTTTVLPSDIVRDVTLGTGKLVVPGDPAASLLWRSLSGELADGDLWGIMPWGYTEPLPSSQIDHVRQWIEDGAILDGRDLGDTGGAQ